MDISPFLLSISPIKMKKTRRSPPQIYKEIKNSSDAGQWMTEQSCKKFNLILNKNLGKVELLWQITLKSTDFTVRLEARVTALWASFKLLSHMRRGFERQIYSSRILYCRPLELKSELLSHCCLLCISMHMYHFMMEGWGYCQCCKATCMSISILSSSTGFACLLGLTALLSTI